MRGEDVKAEELTADNIVIMAQGLGGNCQLGFPSTIYKLCKEAGVRMREFKNMEEVDVGRYITKEEKQKFLAKELDEIKRFQVGQTMMASCIDVIDKLNFTMEELRNEMIVIKRQLKEWTKNASYKDAYCCWAHQQSNPNLIEIPTYKIPDYVKENGEKGRNIFYGCLKSDFQTSSSSQAPPQPIPSAEPFPESDQTPDHH
ncbi:hypothetical protein PIB30_052797 [Stylosanthes scabra]|uniref:Uncharacterized protein n=1 Tax=Stylosanthes scabra TaxID=79078 RepID=A0ABU6UI67_9FABA|nr:hypothetical protein [Stylosanthes scabra]